MPSMLSAGRTESLSLNEEDTSLINLAPITTLKGCPFHSPGVFRRPTLAPEGVEHVDCAFVSENHAICRLFSNLELEQVSLIRRALFSAP